MKPHRQICLSSPPLPPVPIRPGEGDSVLGGGKEVIHWRAPTSVLGGLITRVFGEGVGRVEGPH